MKVPNSFGNQIVPSSSLAGRLLKSPALLLTMGLLLSLGQLARAQQFAPVAPDAMQAAAPQQAVTATGSGTGMNITAADAMATTALNAQKAALDRRYGNTIRWGPVMTTRVLKYSFGRAYYETTKTQSGTLGH